MHVCFSNQCFSIPAIKRPDVILCTDFQVPYTVYRHSQVGVSWSWFLYQSTTHFLTTQRPLPGQGLLIIEALRSHTNTPHSVQLLWKSDQPNAETWQPKTHTRGRHSYAWLDLNPQSQQATHPLLSPHGHWDQSTDIIDYKVSSSPTYCSNSWI